ncbi:Crp/Fnr family transcriptional regulator [Sphingosinicella terrae]|uniref:Crp/Fnr family transcriptional regulator n=1 Tax=Sphingosinicella terrae TaxID=2172047 RepID=UPI000E0D9E63|nr:Crp/Fnr family transcriptional regulator [Sphingosinicella terrae]
MHGSATSSSRSFDAFARLPRQHRAAFEKLARRHLRELAPRRDLTREGDRPSAIRLILDGWACRYKQLPDGRRQIVHILLPGDFCDACHFVAERIDHSVGAITRLAYAEIPAAEIETLITQGSELLRTFWRNEMIEAAIAREWTANVGQRTAYERLAHLFCETFLRLAAIGLAEDASCEWPLTQNDLADATGLTAVHVNRTLQELRREGLIELRGRRLALPDPARLRQVAEFSPLYLHLPAETQHLLAFR